MNYGFITLYFYFAIVQTVDLNRGQKGYMRNPKAGKWKNIDAMKGLISRFYQKELVSNLAFGRQCKQEELSFGK